MARDANQSNNWDYLVETVPLKKKNSDNLLDIIDGSAMSDADKLYAIRRVITGETDTGWFANTRTDTGEVLGVCTEQYGIVNNRDLFAKADETFASRGLIPTNVETIVSGNGSRVRRIYDFKNQVMKVPEVGDKMGMRLQLNNSFDRSLRLAWLLGMLRLACLNGMKTLETEFTLTKRHSKKADFTSLITDQALDSALGRFKDAAGVYTDMSRVAITQEQGLNALQNLANSGKLSETVRESIAQIWNNPTHEEDKGRNLYNLYNAATEHLTHGQDNRFEYADRTSKILLKDFSKATNPKALNKLVKAIPVDEVVTVTE